MHRSRLDDVVDANGGWTNFWDNYNQPFLDQAIARGDVFNFATEISLQTMYLNGVGGALTGYGKEILYLQQRGVVSGLWNF